MKRGMEPFLVLNRTISSKSMIVAFTLVFLQSQTVCTSYSNFYLSTDFIFVIDFIVG